MVGQIQIKIHLSQLDAIRKHQAFAKGGPGFQHFKISLSDAGFNIPGYILVDLAVIGDGKSKNALFYGCFAQKGEGMLRIPGCVAVCVAVKYIQIHKSPLSLCVVKTV